MFDFYCILLTLITCMYCYYVLLWLIAVGSEEHALQWKYCLKKYVDHAGLTEVLNMDFLTDEEED